MAIFERIIWQLEEYGLSSVLLPFFLIFAILFASLQKIKIFQDKKVNVIISLVISLLVVIPHVTNRYPPGRDVVQIINTAIPGVAAVVVAIIMLFIILGLFFGEQNFGGGAIGGWIAMIAIAIVVWIFGSAAGWWTGFDTITRYLGNDIVSLVIIILVFAIVIRFIVSDDTPKAPGSKFMESFGKFFGGK